MSIVSPLTVPNIRSQKNHLVYHDRLPLLEQWNDNNDKRYMSNSIVTPKTITLISVLWGKVKSPWTSSPTLQYKHMKKKMANKDAYIISRDFSNKTMTEYNE